MSRMLAIMNKMFLLTVRLCFVLVLFHTGVARRGDIIPRILENPCSSKNSCSKCIQHPSCAWCSKPNFALPDGTQLDRCNPRDWFQQSDMVGNCKEFMIDSNPDIKIIENEPLTQRLSLKSNLEKKRVQIRPQKLSIKMRPNVPVSVMVLFSQASDYPLDLYYILDQSSSMKQHWLKLFELGKTLEKTMKSITSEFRMGFGSFVDKTLIPFTNEAQAQSESGNQKPFLFQHHMKLSQDTDQLLSKLRNYKARDNLDRPEGCLEALMQAVVCKDQIGWRNDSHKLIVLSTDSPYHIAGDAKLAGITKPNDEQCHINERDNFVYKHERLHDYPSLAQISRQMAENSMNVIFTVPSQVYDTYLDLKKRLQGSHIGIWTENSDNIVQLIRHQYNEIRSVVELRHEASEHVRVHYRSKCLKKHSVETNRCAGLEMGSIVEFNVTIEVDRIKCGKKGNFTELLKIYPVGVNEALSIELDVVCQCSCEQTQSVSFINKQEGNEEHPCMGNGEEICGICECDQGYSGLKCECNEQNASVTTNSKSCIQPTAQNQYEDCSGRGICQCGVCHCHPRASVKEHVWGKYCECDDYSCPFADQQICSGPDHGDCHCGVCQCRPGWQGESCECTTDESKCIAPDSNEPVCSGKGVCSCGECQCQEDEDGLYTGTFCEICPTCSGCVKLKDCVRCLAFQTGPLVSSQCRFCHNITLHDTVEVTSDDERLCGFYDETTCKFFFVYNEFEGTVRVKRHKECSAPADAVAIASGVIGGILLIGLAVLALGKILTTIHDRIEYSRFEKERAVARWGAGDNPLYRRPTSTYVNPAFKVE